MAGDPSAYVEVHLGRSKACRPHLGPSDVEPLLQPRKRHTRSSPIGPAEHEEGGSLRCSAAVSLKLSSAHLISGSVSLGQGCILKCDIYSPAEIREFFVDALESHVYLVDRGVA